MKYRLTIEGDFEKGECEKCPIGVASDILKGKGVVYSCMYALGGGSKEYCPLEEVKQGEWKIIDFDKDEKTVTIECTECGALFKVAMYEFGAGYNYCHVCGADMRGGKE